MRAIIHFPLLTIAAVSVSCAAPPPALRVGVERDDKKDGEVQQQTASSVIAAANPSSPQLDTGDAGGKRWQMLQLSIRAGAMSGEALSVCRGDCLDVNADAQGGNPPYVIAWDDGSSAAQRHVCPAMDSELTASVSDTAIESVEFAYQAQRKMSSVRVVVHDCTTGDGGVMTTVAADSCEVPLSAPCDIAPGISLPEDISVDVPGATTVPFAKGAMLPAGRYRIEYVDGCNTFGLGCDWTVQGSSEQGALGCFIVTNGDKMLGRTPGTTGIFANDDPDVGGAYKTYAECVAANCKDAPVDFDFEGGTLGVLRDGGGVLGAVDDASGESMGGRAPTFRLSRLDGCD